MVALMSCMSQRSLWCGEIFFKRRFTVSEKSKDESVHAACLKETLVFDKKSLYGYMGVVHIERKTEKTCGTFKGQRKRVLVLEVSVVIFLLQNFGRRKRRSLLGFLRKVMAFQDRFLSDTQALVEKEDSNKNCSI